jgi:hypothetical protein
MASLYHHHLVRAGPEALLGIAVIPRHSASCDALRVDNRRQVQTTFYAWAVLDQNSKSGQQI